MVCVDWRSVPVLPCSQRRVEGRGDDGTPPSGEFSGVSITFSTSLAETELPAVQQVIDTFQEASGATVELTQVDSATLPQKLQVEVDSGNHTIHLFAQDNLALAGAGRR